jgi:uncharacterized SAM-binding protein YcdF (DUF218 family)
MTFMLSKIVGAILAPTNLLALLLFLGAALAFSSHEGRARFGRVLSLCLALVMLGFFILPLGEWAIAPLENKFVTMLPRDVEGIVLLTGDENPATSEARGLPIAGHATQRYVLVARLAKIYPKAKILVVGTTAPLVHPKSMTTREVSQRILKDIGVNSARVSYEEKSRTTHENAMFAAKMTKPQKGEKWLLVTSAYHLPRAQLCFEEEKWQTLPVAADYFTLPRIHLHPRLDVANQFRLMRFAMHEYAGLIGYWAAGWIARPW